MFLSLSLSLSLLSLSLSFFAKARKLREEECMSSFSAFSIFLGFWLSSNILDLARLCSVSHHCQRMLKKSKNDVENIRLFCVSLSLSCSLDESEELREKKCTSFQLTGFCFFLVPLFRFLQTVFTFPSLASPVG